MNRQREPARLWASCAQRSLEVWKSHVEGAPTQPHSPTPNFWVTQPTAKTLKSRHIGIEKPGGAREPRALLLVLGWGSSLTSVQYPQWNITTGITVWTSSYHKVLTVTTQAGALSEELHQPTSAHQQEGGGGLSVFAGEVNGFRSLMSWAELSALVTH